MAKIVERGNRKRLDFSRISTSIPIPNLLEVQRESYRQFLQMELLPEERKLKGLEEAFRSVFPIEDFRGDCAIEYVNYSLGDWECRCGNLKGLEYLRQVCKECGSRIIVKDPKVRELQCENCGHKNKNNLKRCPICDDYVSLRIKTSVEECQERGLTYGVPLRVKVRLELYRKEGGKEKSIIDIKEEEVFFGNIPMMTERGTFIINGTERVVVSQLQRSPGVFYQANEQRTEFSVRVIPARGSWVEIQLDAKNNLHLELDRKRKLYATVFLRAMGLGDNETLFRRFYDVDVVKFKKGKAIIKVSERIVNVEVACSYPSCDIKEGSKLTKGQIKKLLKNNITEIEVNIDSLEGAYSLKDVIDETTGEVVLQSGTKITKEKLQEIIEKGIDEIEVIFAENSEIGVSLIETAIKDNCRSQDDAYLEFFRKVRTGDPVTPESAKNFFHLTFFDRKRYDFSHVGALKFYTKLHYDKIKDLDEKELEEVLEKKRILTLDDYCDIVEFLLRIKNRPEELDDIDNLGNRRVRCVGELLENQIRIGLARMEKATKEKMSTISSLSTAMPKDLINAKPIITTIMEFFGTSQLSQFMDQTNPLSEITHKRRLSALGPGGLNRERAGFEVRDVHPSHYGRLCPIETPEGPNIGLISSLSTYARVNKYGFIETPYKKVQNGRVLNHYKITFPGDSSFKMGQIVLEEELKEEIKKLKNQKKVLPQAVPHAFYLTAWEENNYIIAQANSPIDENGYFINKNVECRKGGEAIMAPREEVQFIDVSPKQLVSVAAALIPFLEHDDANRALMGSNMQRQAVPLLKPEAPIVGTDIELIAGKDSGATLVCKKEGIVDQVDANRIIVRVSGGEGEKSYDFGANIYTLTKFKRSNQNTCINQKPIVKVGQHVKEGDVLADGPCTDQGELALGRNVLVAFMPWRGYNYEDAILISEKLVKEDVFTSIHIEELEIQARDTKLGKEEITRDIPNVKESLLSNLDECGIIKIGTTVKPGDYLVGKVTPKGESLMTPEEKLLRAIFGEKAAEYKDASLKCPPGVSGVVVDVKVFTRKDEEKDERTKAIDAEYLASLRKNLSDEVRILREENRKTIMDILEGSICARDLFDNLTQKVVVKEGTVLTRELLSSLRADLLSQIEVKGKSSKATSEIMKKINEIEERTRRKIELLEKEYEEKRANLEKGDDLLPGVIKMVKVYIAMKRKIQEGDKMAGRHGNKGVVSRILPEEDMPFLPDGTPVEIVLNPLGVPSRMNVGQILETHLGWAAKALGLHVSTPVFDGAKEEEIKELLRKAGLPEDGKVYLRDGRTGERFHQKTTVGIIYMMKLAHLVEDKIHARAIGPYSLITQQPLGGKAQFGGQRFGEMEVWALEAYGAANILQEILTVKSDDIYGRTKMYESIVKNKFPEEPGVPESFNVLVKELQGLGIQVNIIKEEEAQKSEPKGV